MTEKVKKKKYSKPKVIEYGSLTQLTRTNTAGSQMDGGSGAESREPKPTMDMCISTVSSLEEHNWLLADEFSQELFKKAVLETVKPGDVVLDLGCGTGIHAFFALEAGAAKVYAVDSDSVIELARQTAVKNGFADKMEFIFGHSNEIELPEKVDVIITNIGFLPTLENLPPAALKFLKPGGKLVPGEISVGFAPIEYSAVLERQIDRWKNPQLGYDFTEFVQYAENRPWYDHLSGEVFLSKLNDFPPMPLESIVNSSYRWSADIEIEKDGTCSALGGWYAFKLSPSVEMTTRPPMKISHKIWFNPVLPLSNPIEVKKGDALKVKIGFFRAGDPFDPIWTWEVEHNGKVISQNSFEGTPLSKELLRKLKPETAQAA